MNSFFKITSATLGLSLALTACGPKSGFDSSSTTDSSSTNEANGTPVDGTVPGGGGSGNGGASWNNVEQFKGVSADAVDGAVLVSIDKAKQALILHLNFPAFSFLSIPMFPQVSAPELQGVELTTVTESDGTTSLAISVPLQYVLKGAQFLPDQRLPNGDALPKFPSGEAPHVALQFPQKPDYRINLYIGVKAVAMFVEMPSFSMPFGFLTDILTKDQTKVIGAAGFIASKGSSPGGLYLAAKLPDNIAIAINELMGW